MKKFNVKNVEFSVDVMALAEYGLTYEELGKTVMELIRAITDGIEPDITERQLPYFDRLYREAKRRAEAWERKTSNFRENNPMKKK